MEIFMENLPRYADFTADEIKFYRKQYKKKHQKWSKWKSAAKWITQSGMAVWEEMTPEGAKNAGRQYEKGFIDFLEDKMEDFEDYPVLQIARMTNLEQKYGKAKVDLLKSKGMKMGEIEAILRTEASQKRKDAAESAKQAKEASKDDKKKILGIISPDEAEKWARENGGKAVEYVGKTYSQGKEIARKYVKVFKEKAEVIATITAITAAKAKEFSEKYGGEAKEYYGMTVAQAEKYGKTLAAKYKKKVKELVPVIGDTIKDQAKKVSNISIEKAGEAKGWFGKQWEAMKKWSDSSPLKKTGEYIEVGKGNFLELYRQGPSAVKEFYETASPEKKAWIRQNAERLLASGQVTVGELKKMGISLKDATVKAADKLGDAVVTTAVNTTQHISTAVNQMGGGGGGANNKMMQEKSMDEITMGNLH
jgi:hypothetical protein